MSSSHRLLLWFLLFFLFKLLLDILGFQVIQRCLITLLCILCSIFYVCRVVDEAIASASGKIFLVLVFDVAVVTSLFYDRLGIVLGTFINKLAAGAATILLSIECYLLVLESLRCCRRRYSGWIISQKSTLIDSCSGSFFVSLLYRISRCVVFHLI